MKNKVQDMPSIAHPWDLEPREAMRLQEELSRHVIDDMPLGEIATVAGIDVGFNGDLAIAALVLLDYPSLAPINTAVSTRRVTFPYVPGLLSFREGPVVMEVLGKLDERPDLIIFDGQGRAHPRRLGIACHIGLLSDVPSIGCGKSRLCGTHEEPATEKASHTPLLDKDETIGAVLRTRSGVRPVFVSAGHRVDLESSMKFVLSCCTRYRLPEPTRLAHRLAAESKQSMGG